MKKLNEYQKLIDPKLYNLIPKTVLAAITVSWLSDGGSCFDRVNDGIKREWWALFYCGIVPQRPPFPEPKDNET